MRAPADRVVLPAWAWSKTAACTLTLRVPDVCACVAAAVGCWCLQDLEYDNLNNPVNFINKYIVLPKNFSSEDTLSFILDKDELDEGEGWTGFRSTLSMV